MPIEIISTLVPKNGSHFATHDSQYGRGGWHSVATLADRDAIPAKRLYAGMACHVLEDSVTYILGQDLVTWGGEVGVVASVNAKTGVVVLNAADVGAVGLTAVGAHDGVASLDAGGLVPAAQLPVASAGTLGGIKVGTGLSINAGVLSASQYDLPIATDSSLGGVIVGSGLVIDVSGVLSTIDTSNPYINVQGQSAASPAVAANGSIAIGGDTNANTSLDAIAIGSGATTDANVSIAIGQAAATSAVGGIAIGGSSAAAGANSVVLGTGAVSLLSEDFVVSVGNALQRRRIIHVAEGIDQNDAVNVGQLAQAISDVTYTLPVAGAGTLGGIKIGTGLSIDVGGILSVDGYTLPAATLTTRGGIIVGTNLEVDSEGLLSIPTASGLVQGVVRVGTGLHMEAGGILALSAASDTDLGGIITGRALTIDVNGTLDADLATNSSVGVISVGAGLSVNGSGSLAADMLSVNGKSGSVVLQAGNSISIDNSGSTIIINATGDANPIQTINSAAGPGAVSLVQDPGSASSAEMRSLVAGTNVTLNLDETLGLITINAALSSAVSTVNNIAPDIDGNVQLVAADVQALSLTGGTLSGNVAMSGNRVTGSGDPVDPQDLVTNVFLDTLLLDAGVYA